MLHQNEPQNHTRMLLTILFAGAVLIAWQSLVELPRRQKLASIAEKQHTQQVLLKVKESKALAQRVGTRNDPSLTRVQRLKQSSRVQFSTGKLQGSLSLKGARFDDITMSKYRTQLDPESPAVTLFSPNGDAQSYFAQAGWVASDGKTKVPDQKTLWRADKSTFGENETVNLSWNNGQNITFVISITLDEHYMFTINQRVENHSGGAISIAPYAYINRLKNEDNAVQNYAILHEGPLGVMEGALEEISYDDLKEENKRFENASGWFGITDKYWLSAIIPAEESFTTQFNHYSKNGGDRYQVDYMADQKNIAAGMQSETSFRLFAGAKEITQIDAYAQGGTGQPPITLFDRSVDFGVLYFLTKPMFLMLHFFYSHIGNFGVAILLLTIFIKLLMFPLANKSYKSASQMRALQPEVAKLRERHSDDAMRMQQETMALWKREKVNPAAGCLPVMLQMPVFFALYKVLFVTIEMRHAPFFGWITDLSVIDPSNIFTAFGLLDWSHPSWMHLGILPILMCLTMVIQMKQQPKPADPVQAKIIGFMPYFFLLIFATFPAGLVLYWVWNNILSIAQQYIISRKYGKPSSASKK